MIVNMLVPINFATNNFVPCAYSQLDTGEIAGPLWAFDNQQRLNGFVEPQCSPMRHPTLPEAIAEMYPNYDTVVPTLAGNQYYPRMSRTREELLVIGKTVPRVKDTPYLSSFIGSLQQLESLFASLSDIFLIAYPKTPNLNVYGAAIRDLIILACTEVEAQWKAVLVANNHTKPGERP